MSIPAFTRRQSLLAIATTLLPFVARADIKAPASFALSAALSALERKSGGRLGVAVLDTATGTITGHRTGERFAMCSTFKLLLAALVLKEVDAGKLQLDQFVAYGKQDLVPYAPVTEKHLAQGGMTVSALAQAAQQQSDNVAGNLLLGLIGGPAGFTARLRAMGDATTRLDRIEPALNVVKPGDLRDTTSPAAMARSVSRLLLDGSPHALKPASTGLLLGWMADTQTGRKRIRAGLPKDWKAGDKTGTGMAPGMVDKYNDVAIAWPPGRAPLVISAYYETAVAHGDMRDEDQAVLAEVGRLAAG